MAIKPNTDESTVAALTPGDWFFQKTEPLFYSDDYANYMAFMSGMVWWRTGSDRNGNNYFVTLCDDEDGQWLLRRVVSASGDTTVEEEIFENPELYYWGS